MSEPITPTGGGFELHAMASGEPGLPDGFTWRGTRYTIAALSEQWKHSEPEGGKAGGERYLRRHYYRLQMSDGSTWTVYFVRQTPRSGSPKRRWFLYSIETDEA